MSESKIRGPRVHRPAASATWEYEHRWGPLIGDSTTLRVRRHDGALSISYGKDSIDIRGELVAILAEMVAAATAWTDSPTTHAAAAAPTEGER